MAVPQEPYALVEWPTVSEDSSRWKIIRASQHKPIKLMCYSARPLWCKTHFWQRRTTPCLKAACPACSAGYAPRTNGYLLAVDLDEKRHVLVEVTDQPAADMQAHLERWGTLRGFNMILGRVTKKANGKVYLAIKGMNEGAHAMPPEESTWSVMCHIFGLRLEAIPNLHVKVENDLQNDDDVKNAIDYVREVDDADWLNARIKPAAEQLALSLPGMVKIGETINGLNVRTQRMDQLNMH